MATKTINQFTEDAAPAATDSFLKQSDANVTRRSPLSALGATHDHDDRYYTQADADTLIAAKQDALITVTQTEAEVGTATVVRLWTPQRVGQAIAALAPSGGAGGATSTAQLTDFDYSGGAAEAGDIPVHNGTDYVPTAEAALTLPTNGFAVGGAAGPEAKTKEQTQQILNVHAPEGSYFFPAPANGVLHVIRVPFALRLDGVIRRSAAGSGTLAFAKGGVALSGLSGLSVNTTESQANATGTGSDNVFAVNNRLSITLSSASSLTGLEVHLLWTRL